MTRKNISRACLALSAVPAIAALLLVAFRSLGSTAENGSIIFGSGSRSALLASVALAQVLGGLGWALGYEPGERLLRTVSRIVAAAAAAVAVLTGCLVLHWA